MSPDNVSSWFAEVICFEPFTYLAVGFAGEFNSEAADAAIGARSST